jgi:prophage DNA circulation protein
VYYGPKTVAQAEAEVARIVESESALPIESQTATSEIVLGLAEKMNRAGYTKAARKLQTQYDV